MAATVHPISGGAALGGLDDSVKLKMAGTRRWRTAAAEIAKRREDETHITKEYPVYALHSELNAMCPTIKNTGSIIGVPAHLALIENIVFNSWRNVTLKVVIIYLIAVLVFAVLFILAGVVNGDGGNGHQSFEDAFLLSLQSFSTIGYGVLSPETRWGHAVVFFQSIFSMIFTGVVSGAIFFKFILPHCRIRYASNVVIYKRPSDGKRVMQLRSVSAPGCYLLNTVVKLEVAMWVLDHKGRTTGERLFPLKLTMDHFIIGLTAGTYTHVIDDESPLRNMTEDTCAKVFKHMTFGLVGTESHTSMTCTSAKIYSAADVVFGKKYADFFSVVDGKAEVDGTRLNLLADLPISDGSDDANSKSMPAIRRLVETMIRATSDGKEPPPNATVVGDGGGKKPEFFEKAVHAENVPPKRSESFAFV